MKCALCKRLGVWSPRFGMILCNACKRGLDSGALPCSLPSPRPSGRAMALNCEKSPRSLAERRAKS